MEEKLSQEEELFIKRFQEDLEVDQEEVKHALNINRQQRKQYLRKKEKELKAVNNLTPIQIGIMTKLLNKEKERMDICIEETRMSTYSCINATLTELYDFKNDELINIWNKTNDLLEEDIEARRTLGELTKEEMDKMDKNVKIRVGELIQEGKKQKEIIETIKKEFPKLSAAMRMNAYKEVKEEIEKVKREKDEEIKELKEDIDEEKEKLIGGAALPTENFSDTAVSLACDGAETKKYIMGASMLVAEVKKEKSIVEQLEEKISVCIQSKRETTEEIEKLRKIISDKENYLKTLNEEEDSFTKALDILKPLNV